MNVTRHAVDPTLETRPARVCGLPFSAALAAVVSIAFVASAPIERLPILGWVAAFLFFAMESDLRSLRIPNTLNLVGGVAALILACYWGGFEAGAWALGAAILTFALLFPLYAARILGAGDVKALMVLAAFFGASALPGLLWWSAVCGGLAGLVWITLRGGLLDLVKRWTSTLSILIASRRLVYVPPAASSAAAQGLPFALAIGVGATALQLCGDAMGVSLIRRRRAGGSAMVETAIVLPILAMLLFAIAEFSIGFLRWQAVTTAAREGAREASLFRQDCPANVNAAVTQAIDDVLDAARLSGATIDVNGTCVSPGSSRVTVSVPYSFVVLPNFSAVSRSINLTSTSVMRNSSLAGAGV